MRHSVVIGGTRGIGREVVRRLAAAGDEVSVIGMRAPNPDDLPQEGVNHWCCDITAPPELERTLSEIVSRGKLGNLVFAQRYRGSGDPWDGECTTSLTATKTVIERLAPEFAAEGGGIVLVSSIVSQLVADEQQVGYHVAKAGLHQMARYYAVALGGRGIRVNTVSPSIFIKEESQEYYRQSEELCALFRRITPLGRIGSAGEVADVIAFLCSSQASFITGQDLIVDGGVSLQAQPTLARKI